MTSAIEKENNALGELISINKDACAFYHSAAKKVENMQLARTFQDLENLHAGVAASLARQIRQNGGSAKDEEGTLSGKAAQWYAEILAKVSNDADETLVSQLEEAEDRCLHHMQDALKDDDIRVQTKSLLASELTSLERSHDYMRNLKKFMKAA
ncbi:MAG TPA: PA2169 family four-helix-bundle protein [Alphaproteobacteria bacterium]|nr:PA2169 family four-helix-bundle protein [Alphaproteobacteria bacterium]